MTLRCQWIRVLALGLRSSIPTSDWFTSTFDLWMEDAAGYGSPHAAPTPRDRSLPFVHFPFVSGPQRLVGPPTVTACRCDPEWGFAIEAQDAANGTQNDGVDRVSQKRPLHISHGACSPPTLSARCLFCAASRLVDRTNNLLHPPSQSRPLITLTCKFRCFMFPADGKISGVIDPGPSLHPSSNILRRRHRRRWWAW